MALKSVRRIYPCTDGTLIQKASQIANCVTRDQNSFSGFGVLPATVTAFRALLTAFDTKVTDDESLGDQTTATAQKDSIRKQLEHQLRLTRGIAQDVYKGMGKYRKFGFEDFNKMPDNDFLRMAKRVQRVCVELQGEVVDDRPVIVDIINDLETLTGEFDTALDTVADKKNDRDIKTQDRIISGNRLFTELTRLCNIGKTIFQDTDAAKYNDFILNLQPAVASAKITGVITVINTTATMADVKVTTQSGDKVFVVNSDSEGKYSLTVPAAGYTITFEKEGYLTGQTSVELLAGKTIVKDFQMTTEA